MATDVLEYNDIYLLVRGALVRFILFWWHHPVTCAKILSREEMGKHFLAVVICWLKVTFHEFGRWVH